MVYVRDVANAVSIVFGCMMFALPIMYLAKQRSTPMMELFWSVNPMYYYIESIHNAIYFGAPTTLIFYVISGISAVVSFIVGIIVFKKLEKGFAERL